MVGALLCIRIWKKTHLTKHQSIYLHILRFLEKEFTDRTVPQGQLSHKANGKNEALTDGREVKNLSS